MKFIRLTHAKKNRLLQCFIEDVTAATAAKLSLVNRKTANTWYAELRKRLLVRVTTLPDIADHGRFLAYHERRIARFNGVAEASKRAFLIESRLRYQLKSTFAGAVLDVATDLLD